MSKERAKAINAGPFPFSCECKEIWQAATLLLCWWTRLLLSCLLFASVQAVHSVPWLTVNLGATRRKLSWASHWEGIGLTCLSRLCAWGFLQTQLSPPSPAISHCRKGKAHAKWQQRSRLFPLTCPKAPQNPEPSSHAELVQVQDRLRSKRHWPALKHSINLTFLSSMISGLYFIWQV